MFLRIKIFITFAIVLYAFSVKLLQLIIRENSFRELNRFINF